MKSASDHPMVQNVKASSEELRACLINGTVLLQLLNKLRPGYAYKSGSSSSGKMLSSFWASMDEMGILKFEPSDLEKVIQWIYERTLWIAFQHFEHNSHIWELFLPLVGINMAALCGDASSTGLSSSTFRAEKRTFSTESKIQQALRSPVMTGKASSLVLDKVCGFNMRTMIGLRGWDDEISIYLYAMKIARNLPLKHVWT
ncbi:hypothetical protein NC652_034714 [Populus alba x Populus x berolinensis]|nr:hypothetical protein NC652_034714 [Populus alba x Populus x berolinensis]